MELVKEWHKKRVKIPQKVWKDGKLRAQPPKIVQIPRDISHFVMNLPGSAIEFLGTNIV